MATKTIPTDQIRVICRVLDGLAAQLDDTEKDQAEQYLVGLAATTGAIRAMDVKARRSFVREHADLTPEVQLILAMDEDWHVRCALADRFDLTPEVQTILAADEDGDVRYTLAENFADLAPEAQALLAMEEGQDISVRRGLITRHDLTPAVQAILAMDDDADVRSALAERDDLTPEVQAIFDRAA